MTEEIQDIFDEIRNIMQPDMDCTARYHALDALLLRALKDRTRHSPVDFTHTAARLHWLCKQTGHPSHPLEVFRARAGRIQKGLFLPDGEDWQLFTKPMFRKTCKNACPAIGDPLPHLPKKYRRPNVSGSRCTGGTSISFMEKTTRIPRNNC